MGILQNYIGIPLRLAHLSVLTQVNKLLAHVHLTPVDFAVLAVIDCNPQAVQGDLARLLSVKKGNFAPLIMRLEKLSLVRRVSSSTDGRSHHLRLTQLGATELVQGQKLHDALEEHLVEHMGRPAHDQLLRLLQSLAAIPPMRLAKASARQQRKTRVKAP
jgi:DNA-binding MarR family transcriptional regulator